MSKRRKNKNNHRQQANKPKSIKRFANTWSPVEKPGDGLMPMCTRCKKRPVSDARKGECGRCSISYKGHGYSFDHDVRSVERQFFGI